MPEKAVLTTEHLQEWLSERIAAEIGGQASDIDMDASFSSFSLDSLSTVSLSYELEIYTGLVVDPTVFFEFDTPNKLIQWVQSQAK
jgi:acyl carrier protein